MTRSWQRKNNTRGGQKRPVNLIVPRSSVQGIGHNRKWPKDDAKPVEAKKEEEQRDRSVSSRRERKKVKASEGGISP